VSESTAASTDRRRSLIQAIRETHRTTTALVNEASDQQARQPSGLPGWSRAHVIVHLDQVAHALTRQADYAAAGRLVDMYDGDRAGRDAAITARAGSPIADLKQSFTDATDLLWQSWDALRPEDWSRPVRFRDGVVLDTVFCYWRELHIHTADLNLGYRPAHWPTEFCLHLLEFLRPRTPPGSRLILRATDQPITWIEGAGPATVVRGALTDLAAWMAGRPTAQPLECDQPDLPHLASWP
jgi:maleylpyruvate isomerase